MKFEDKAILASEPRGISDLRSQMTVVKDWFSSVSLHDDLAEQFFQNIEKMVA